MFCYEKRLVWVKFSCCFSNPLGKHKWLLTYFPTMHAGMEGWKLKPQKALFTFAKLEMSFKYNKNLSMLWKEYWDTCESKERAFFSLFSPSFWQFSIVGRFHKRRARGWDDAFHWSTVLCSILPLQCSEMRERKKERKVRVLTPTLPFSLMSSTGWTNLWNFLDFLWRNHY